MNQLINKEENITQNPSAPKNSVIFDVFPSNNFNTWYVDIFISG